MVSQILLTWPFQLKDSSRRIGFHTYYSTALRELEKLRQFLPLRGEYMGLIIENKFLRYVRSLQRVEATVIKNHALF